VTNDRNCSDRRFVPVPKRYFLRATCGSSARHKTTKATRFLIPIAILFRFTRDFFTAPGKLVSAAGALLSYGGTNDVDNDLGKSKSRRRTETIIRQAIRTETRLCKSKYSPRSSSIRSLYGVRSCTNRTLKSHVIYCPFTLCVCSLPRVHSNDVHSCYCFCTGSVYRYGTYISSFF